MKCLIIDKVYAGIAEELGKFMEVKTAEHLHPPRSRFWLRSAMWTC